MAGYRFLSVYHIGHRAILISPHLAVLRKKYQKHKNTDPPTRFSGIVQTAEAKAERRQQ